MERSDVSGLAPRKVIVVNNLSIKRQLTKYQRLIVMGMVSALLLLMAFSMSGIENVLQRLISISPAALAGILVLLIANLFQVTFRLWRVLAHFGFPLSWNVAFRASISGHLAGLFVISLFGQVLGRQAILRKYGVLPVVIASLSAYERALLALISGILAMFGETFLLGPSVVADFFRLMPFGEIAIVAVGGVALSWWLGRSGFERRVAARIRSWSAFSCLLESAGITLISQSLVLGSFVVGIQAVHPGLDILPLFAAAAVISFAASIPITVNGWGIREVAAVYVLGGLGISAADAVAVSVLIGLCSTIVIVAASPFVLKKRTDTDSSVAESLPMIEPAHEVEKASAWILAMATAVLVFFQVHAELPGSLGPINFNLADPFAVLALAAVSIHALFVRHAPVWRVQSFNVILVLISAALLVAFLRGALEIGVTQWALAGRVFGWLVLLGYISAGYLMVVYAGAHGLRRLSETMIATGVVVVVLQIILRLLVQGGWLEKNSSAGNFEGYAANRNAFVFQMLVCVALVLAYSSVRARHRTIGYAPQCISSPMCRWSFSHLFPSLLGVVLVGVILSGSRAGWLVCVVMLLAAWIGRLADRHVMVWGLICAIVFWGMMLIGGAIQGGAFMDIILKGSAIQSAISSEGSGQEHRESMARALELWLQSPVMGAGLGIFIEKSPVWFGHPLVVHSTPLWILAEFGMVGASVFGWAFFMVARSAFKFDAKSSAHRALGLLLLSFAGFCLVHEIFYQRIFWLVLGAMLAYPGRMGGLPQELKRQGIHIGTREEAALFSPGFDAQAGRVSVGVDQGTILRESSVLEG
ncbi:MAG: lysylphosphatidylglycerol synthase domain-containing protein [Nitrospirota bacterium]|nr:lysylphosphatidylglycerol synthase domain-containing protein [Nitrospirota bacterium]